MRVLVACEESQAVTAAFRKRGHDAFSCDLLPCSGGHPEWHICGDVIPQLSLPWDLVLAFPPCTHLAVSGSRHFAKKIADGRQASGIGFFLAFTQIKCPWAIENPIGIMSSRYRKPDQIIQPFWFGHTAKKSTCLWLHGLPKLVPTEIVEPNLWVGKNGKTFSADYMDGVKRGKAGEASVQRSKTYTGVAAAMAAQWGGER